MGHERKRRKSTGGLPAQPNKEQRLDDDYPTWKEQSGYTVLQLLNTQNVLFVGEATLQVLHGAVRIAGKLVTVESPPLELSTGGRFSLAINITAEVKVIQVPFVDSCQAAEVSLQSRPRVQPAGSGSIIPDLQPPAPPPPPQQQACTFSLYRPTDPRAPPTTLISMEWDKALKDVCSAASAGVPLVVAVLGAKGLGKSSLTRLLSNSLLDSCPAVAYLDSDVGQPEFTPPGLMSLHLLNPDCPALGPPHAHSRKPWAARFVGDISPEHDPQLYLAAAQTLYGSYWSWAQSRVAGGASWPPLVINTHGWVKGLGFDLLTQMLRLLAPTHVIQIRCASERKNLPRGAFWCDPRDAQSAAAAPAVLITLNTLVDAAAQAAATGGGCSQDTATTAAGGSGPTSSGGGGASANPRDCEASGSSRPRSGGGQAVTLRSLKPVDWRALAWHAWAKRVVGSNPAWGSYESEDFWRNAGALASLPPWRVSLDDLHVQLLGGSLPPQQLGRLLNGAVVGLMATTAPVTQRQPVEVAPWDLDFASAAVVYQPGRVSYMGATAVPPPLLPCVGLGIVRAVDMVSRTAYVLTDVDEDILECIGVLVVGRLELPGSLVVGGEVASPYQQLFGLSAEATGAGAGKARKNLSRSSLVEMA